MGTPIKPVVFLSSFTCIKRILDMDIYWSDKNPYTFLNAQVDILSHKLGRSHRYTYYNGEIKSERT